MQVIGGWLVVYDQVVVGVVEFDFEVIDGFVVFYYVMGDVEVVVVEGCNCVLELVFYYVVYGEYFGVDLFQILVILFGGMIVGYVMFLKRIFINNLYSVMIMVWGVVWVQ